MKERCCKWCGEPITDSRKRMLCRTCLSQRSARRTSDIPDTIKKKGLTGDLRSIEAFNHEAIVRGISYGKLAAEKILHTLSMQRQSV